MQGSPCPRSRSVVIHGSAPLGGGLRPLGGLGEGLRFPAERRDASAERSHAARAILKAPADVTGPSCALCRHIRRVCLRCPRSARITPSASPADSAVFKCRAAIAPSIDVRQRLLICGHRTRSPFRWRRSPGTPRGWRCTCVRWRSRIHCPSCRSVPSGPCRWRSCPGGPLAFPA